MKMVSFFLVFVVVCCFQEVVSQLQFNSQTCQQVFQDEESYKSHGGETLNKDDPFAVVIQCYHNRYRDAAEIPLMTWNSDLSKAASSWASHLKKSKNCGMQESNPDKRSGLGGITKNARSKLKELWDKYYLGKHPNGTDPPPPPPTIQVEINNNTTINSTEKSQEAKTNPQEDNNTTNNLGLNKRAGENQFWAMISSSISNNILLDFAKEAVESWFNEVEYYHFAGESKGHKQCPMTGVVKYFTQVMWETSTEVGCGYEVCGTDIIVVCNYYEAGNDPNSAMFKSNKNFCSLNKKLDTLGAPITTMGTCFGFSCDPDSS